MPFLSRQLAGRIARRLTRTFRSSVDCLSARSAACPTAHRTAHRTDHSPAYSLFPLVGGSPDGLLVGLPIPTDRHWLARRLIGGISHRLTCPFCLSADFWMDFLLPRSTDYQLGRR